MALNMQDLQARLRERSSGNKGSGGGDKANYAFWNIPFDSTATVRFLPDGDESNGFFWVEKVVLKLPFAGVKGGKDEEVTVTVPTLSSFGKTCMILAEAASLFKQSDSLKAEGRLEESESVRNRARAYYKKQTAIYQGFVRDDPMKEAETPENPIRRFVINKSIHTKIVESIKNARFKDLPCDYDAGRDFWIVRRKQGQWPSYHDSSWDLEGPSALTDAELDAIEKFGLQDLSKFLPKEPTSEEQAAIMEMFEASKNGEEYDPEKWAHYYRPFGVAKPDATAGTSAPAPKPEVKAEVKEAPKAADTDTADVEAAPAPKAKPKAKPKAEAKAETTADSSDADSPGSIAKSILANLDADGA